MNKLLLVLPVIPLVAAGCLSTSTFRPTSQTQPTEQQQTAQNSELIPTSLPAQNEAPATTPPPTQATTNELVIKEWSVKFSKPEGLSDIEYEINPTGHAQNNTYTGFTTQRLLNLDKVRSCSDYFIGGLFRFSDKELQYYKSPNGPGVGPYVKIGGYDYTFIKPQEPCSHNQQFAQLEVEQTNILAPVILSTLRSTTVQ